MAPRDGRSAVPKPPRSAHPFRRPKSTPMEWVILGSHVPQCRKQKWKEKKHFIILHQIYIKGKRPSFICKGKQITHPSWSPPLLPPCASLRAHSLEVLSCWCSSRFHLGDLWVLKQTRESLAWSSDSQSSTAWRNQSPKFCNSNWFRIVWWWWDRIGFQTVESIIDTAITCAYHIPHSWWCVS